MEFDQAFDALLGQEGGYANDPRDPGGETMWGVTARMARAEGYTGEMKALPQATARGIYRRRYWDALQADTLPPALRLPLFDAAVNSGPVQAIRWLQRALGVREDGVLGPVTRAAAWQLGGQAAVRLNAERLEFMTALPAWTRFGRGWARRIAALLKQHGQV